MEDVGKRVNLQFPHPVATDQEIDRNGDEQEAIHSDDDLLRRERDEIAADEASKRHAPAERHHIDAQHTSP